jgi:predicted RND superfamily exporter protein/glutaredoxin
MPMESSPSPPPRRFDIYTSVIKTARRLDRHYLVILLVAALLTVGAIHVTGKLRFDSDLANLLPPDHPDLKILRKIQSKYSSDTAFIVLLSKNYVFLADEAGEIHLHNGKNWIRRPAGTVVRALHGFSAGEVFGVGDGGRFVRFDPRGVRWQSSETGARVTLRGLWGSASDRLIAVGDQGTALRYDGRSWHPIATGTRHALRAVAGAGKLAFAVGDGGTVLRLEGDRLVPETLPGIDVDLSAVWVAAGGEAFAAGSRGTLLRRRDGKWEAIPTGTRAMLHGIWGSGVNDLHVVGEGGIALRWDGERLSRGQTRTRAELRAVHGSSRDDLWAVGLDCAVRRNSGGAEWGDGPIDSKVGTAVFRWYAVFRHEKPKVCSARFTAVFRPKGDLAQAKALAPKLAASLEASKMVSRVDWSKPLRFFWDRAFYYAGVEDLEKVRDAIEEALEHETAKGTGLYVDLEDTPASGSRARGRVRGGATDGGEDLGGLLKKYRAEVGQLGSSEWYEHPDGTSIGLIVYPAQGLSDLQSLRPMKAEIERIVGAATIERVDPLLRWDIGGDGVNKILEYDATLFDIFGTLWIPVVGIILLIILYFRRLVGLLLSMIPLGMSIAWTAALTTLTIGTLNFVTGFLFAVLTGLGIDYGIQLFGRYREGRSVGLSPEDAMDHVILDTGRATLTSAITTSVALLTMCITEFRGFSEFGFIAGIGILLALASYLLVLPAMIFLFERLGLLRIKVQRARAASEDVAPGQEPFRLPRVVLAVSIAITAYGIYGATRLSFEHDTRKLRNVRQEDEIENRSGQTFGQSFTPTMFLAGSRDELEAGIAGLRRRTASLGKQSGVARIVSILDLVPGRQHEKRTILDAIDRMLHDKRWNLVSDADKQRLKLEDLRRMARARPFTLEELPKEVRRAFRGPGFGEVWLGLVFYSIDVGHILEAKRLKQEVGAVPGASWVHLGGLVPVGSKLFAEAGRAEIACPPGSLEACRASVPRTLAALQHEGKPVIAEVVGREEAYRRKLAAPGSLRGELLALAQPGFILRGDRGAKSVQPSGIYHVSSGELVLVEVVEVMLRDGKLAFALAFLAVFLSTLIDFRSLRLPLLALLPLGLGFLWTFGLMQLLQLKLNMFNFVILPALLGIGIDYGVHYVHRYREEGEGNLGRVMRSLYWVIFYCAATTVVGFGNVTFASQPGLKSLGNLAIIGMTCIFFAATYTLPAVLYAIERWRGVRPPAAVAAAGRVVVYATSYCPSCRLVRRFLSERGVPFAWIELDTLPQGDRERIARELVAASGADDLPVTKVEDRYAVGFDPAKLAELLSPLRPPQS